MNPLRTALFTVLALGPLSAIAAPMTDSDILNKIHSIDQGEIAAAALAQKSSTNRGVKKFAASMTHDHGQADREVLALAQKKGITLTDVEPGPSPLSSLSGAEFDSGYATAMVKGHQGAMAFLAEADSATSDADVKKLVEKLQPIVACHEKMAEKLQSKVGASASL